MKLSHFLPFLLMLGGTPLAQAEVFKCTDADGRTVYTNDRALSRGCKVLDQSHGVSTVPAVVPRSTTGAQGAGQPGFPQVTPDAQRARDDSRRQVLESELSTEEQSLAEAQKALTDQEAVRMGDERNYQRVLDRLQPFKDKVELHQRNIEALKRELSGLR